MRAVVKGTNVTLRLETERLALRNWEDGDRDLFYRINSDDRVMRFFPFRRTREQTDPLMLEWRDDVRENGFGWCAIADKSSDVAIGFCGISNCDLKPVFEAEMFEIGWRLAPEFWGKGYASEAASAWIQFGFEQLGLDEIVSFAVAENTASTAVMQRIGMSHDASRDFDHPNVNDEFVSLKRHVFYAITRQDYEKH